MTLNDWINLLVTSTLIEMMVAVGLSVRLGELLEVATNWRLVGKAMLANYVIVPAATIALLLLFAPHPLVAVGFLILAVCPGAPFGPPLATLARGNVPVAIGSMVILAGSSALLAPLLLRCLLPLVASDQPLTVDARRIVFTLLLTQLVPLCVGVALRQWRPLLANRLQQPANLLSRLMNLLVVGLILLTQFQLLYEIRPRGYVGMLLLLLASWAAGWFLGGPEEDQRKALTLTTSLRNVGVALVIATSTFSGTPVVTAVLAYGLFEIFGTLLLALGWSRQTPSPLHSPV